MSSDHKPTDAERLAQIRERLQIAQSLATTPPRGMTDWYAEDVAFLLHVLANLERAKRVLSALRYISTDARMMDLNKVEADIREVLVALDGEVES